MSKIKIEDYRGFEISFDTDAEVFCTFSDTYDKDSENKSFTAAKKYVDDYIKNNADFKRFKVEPNPVNGYGKTGWIIGIRKDGRFVLETENGTKQQISDYDLKNYVIPNSDNEPIVNLIRQKEDYIKNIYSEIKELKSTLKLTTLADIKNNYVQ